MDKKDDTQNFNSIDDALKKLEKAKKIIQKKERKVRDKRKKKKIDTSKHSLLYYVKTKEDDKKINRRIKKNNKLINSRRIKGTMTGTKLAPIAETKDITEKEVKVPITPINPFEPSNKSPSTSLENNLEGLNAGLDMLESQAEVPITPRNPFNQADLPINPFDSYDNNPFDDLESLNSEGYVPENSSDIEEESITSEQKFNKEMELAKQESLRDYKLGFEKDKNLFNIEIQTAITLSLKDQEKLEGKSKKNRFFSMLSNLASSPKKRNNKNSLRNDDIKKSSGNNNKKGLS